MGITVSAGVLTTVVTDRTPSALFDAGHGAVTVAGVFSQQIELSAGIRVHHLSGRGDLSGAEPSRQVGIL